MRALMAFVALELSCGPSEPSLPCVDVDVECQPLHDPADWNAVFTRTLSPTCATGTGTCHTSDGEMGGLVFEDADESYELLLGSADGRARVVAGDPECSLLVRRLRASSRSLRMPPGPTPLSDAEICTVVRWIADGAEP